MDYHQLRQLALEIINKEKWWDILSRFIDVLHINIFIVDSHGAVILPPEEGRYGGRFLANRPLGPGTGETAAFLDKFEPHGPYLEYIDPFKLHQFAIPLHMNGEETLGYMIVGPVVLNRRLEKTDYETVANTLGLKSGEFIDEINGIRVVSNVMINSILDLLHEIVKNNIELGHIKKEIYKKEEGEEEIPREVKNAAKDIYSTACLDELLITFLDLSIKMTGTECGSIMIADKEKKGDLTIKFSRGLDMGKIQNARIRIGEGIAGTAAKEKSPYIIHGQTGSNRIKPFLKRPEIKHALVMPLMAKSRVFGVLNLHTTEDLNNIEGNLENLQYLAQLVASVL